MKKLIITLLILCSALALHAETVRVYCRMNYSWWTEGDAAIAAYAYGEGEGAPSNAGWPGQAMTNMYDGQGTWYIDLENIYSKIIFARVSSDGELSDWNAQTSDLDFPVDGNTLYVITSETGVWHTNLETVTGYWTTYTEGGDPTGNPTGGDTGETTLYSTSFQEWDSQTVTSEMTFNYSGIEFTVNNAKIVTNQTPTSVSGASAGYIQPYSSGTLSNCYIQTGRLDYVSTVRFTHASANSNGGWKLESSSNGVDFYAFNENETGCTTARQAEEKEVYVFMENVWLRWTPITTGSTSTNIYLTDITISGTNSGSAGGDPQGGNIQTYTITFYAPDACPAMKPAIMGDFNGWSTYETMTSATSGEGRTYYTYTFPSQEGMKFRIGEQSDPENNKLQYYEDNQWINYEDYILTAETEIVLDHSNNAMYRFSQCTGGGTGGNTGNEGNYTNLLSKFGVLLNHDRYVPSEYVGVEYDHAQYRARVSMSQGDTVRMIDFSEGNVTWLPTPEEGGAYAAFSYMGDENCMICQQAGCYDVYFKQYIGESATTDQLYVAYGNECSAPSAYTGALAETAIITLQSVNDYQNTVGRVSMNGRGKNETGMVYDQHIKGTYVTIEAYPFTDYVFLRWSDGSVENPRQLLVSGDTTLNAVMGLEMEYPLGLLVNNNKFIRASERTRDDGEQDVVHAQLQSGDQFVVYNFSTGDSYLPAIEAYGMYANFEGGTDGMPYTCKQTSCYDVYIKKSYNLDIESLYIGPGSVACSAGVDYTPASQPLNTYYLTGSFNNWSLADAFFMDGDSILLTDLAQGTYEFKVLLNNTSWDGVLGSQSINWSCTTSDISIGGEDNVVISLAEGASLRVRIVDGKICANAVYGAVVDDYVYSVLGTSALFGTDWDYSDTRTEMSPQGDNQYIYLLDSVTLRAGIDYEYKVVTNHTVNVREWPSIEGGDNYHIIVEESGVYQVLFLLDPNTGCSATTNYLHAIIEEQPQLTSKSWHISPSSPYDSDNLRLTMAEALSGDTIFLADGIYNESNMNYLAFTKNLLLMAEAGASPVIRPQTPFTISNGANAQMIDIKIDASNLNAANTYDHLIYAKDDNEANGLYMVRCELYNFTNNNSAIYCSSANTLSACFFLDCYIHDMTKTVMFFENESLQQLTISGSTFANITTNNEGYYAAVIDARGANTSVYVDHCTFYNCQVMNSDYGAIKASNASDVIVTNSIFAMPESYDAGRSVYANNGTVGFCIMYNYTKDSGLGIHSGPAIDGCSSVDPMFVDAANGDFTLGAGSPAYSASNEGSAIGDPRWATNAGGGGGDQPCNPISGICGVSDQLTWTLDCDSTFTLTGTGAMNEGDDDNWYAYRNEISKAIIGDGITNLVSYAFRQSETLREAIIGEGVTKIGNSAFYGCNTLRTAVIPSTVDTIEDQAFRSCAYIQSIELPASLKYIGAWGFAYCYIEISSITCHATTPPACGSEPFYEISTSTPLYVPGRAVEAYRSADGWSTFTDIRVIPGTEVCDPIASGTCGADGDNVTWEITCDSTLIFRGSGAMNEYNYDFQRPWSGYHKTVKRGVVEPGITYLTPYAFANCSLMVSVSIPEGLTSLGKQTFYQCHSLRTLEIPSSVTSLGDDVCFNCKSLSTLVLHDNITSIGKDAFMHAIFQSVHIPAGLTEIPAGMFGECDSLKYVELPSGITKIGENAFNGCTMQHVTIPAKVDTIETQAFRACIYFDYIDLPASVTYIGSWAFANCSSIDSLICRAIIPPTLDGEPFYDISTSKPVYVPKRSMAAYQAAEGWKNFTNYHALPECLIASGECGAEGDNVTWELTCDSIMYISGTGAMATYTTNSNGQAPWASYGSQISEIIIEEGVTSISPYGFYNAGSYTNGAYNNVHSVTIPSTVSTLANNYFYQCPLLTVTINSDTIVGKGSYSSSSNLQNIFGVQVRQYIIGEGVTAIASSAFHNQSPDSLRSVILPEGITSIGTWAFGYLENLDSIILPSTLQTIDADAFYGSGLRHITIPAGVTEMGGQAFQNCDKLTSVTLQEGLTQIGTSAFTNCTALPEITIPESIETIGSGAFTGCTNLTKMTVLSSAWVAETKSSSTTTKQALGGYVRELVLGDNITTIGKYAFTSLDSLRRVSFPSSLTVIGEYAFSACKSLQSVILPNSVTTIANYAFNGCTALDSIQLGEGLLRIGNSAFYQCTSLSRLTLPESLKAINSTAFYQCTGLTEMIIPSGVDSLGTNIFGGCTNLATLTINSNDLCSQNYSTSTNIKSAFNQDAIKTYIIGEGVTAIGKYAFYNAPMTALVLPSTLTSVDQGSFGSCTSLTRVTSNALTPPTLLSNSFSKQDTLIVPCEAQNAYKAADYWKNFSHVAGSIIASGTCGVNDNLIWELSCDSIFTIRGTGEMPSYSSTATPWWSYGSEMREIVIADGVTNVGAYAFYNSNGAYNNVRTLVLGDSIKVIGRNTFSKFRSLNSVTFPSHLTEVGAYAFQECESLKAVTLPNTVTTISEDAFEDCGSIDSLTLGDQLVRIDAYAFKNCSSLTHVDLPESLNVIGSYAFAGCTGLTEMVIPANVDSLGSSILDGSTNITILTVNSNALCSRNYSTYPNIRSAFNQSAIKTYVVGEGVTALGRNAFYGSSMTATVLPSTLTQIGDSAFSWCNSLTTVTCNALTPPVIDASTTFSKKDTLIVPCEAKASYKAADYWQNFRKIRCEGEVEMTIDLTSDWTFLMLPTAFSMNAEDITTSGAVEWGTYNGSLRAMGRSGWENYDAAAVYMCSQALIVRATNGTATLTFTVPRQATNRVGTTMTLYYHEALHEQNANWNFLGNPYPYAYDIMSALAAQGFEAPITVWNGTGYQMYTPGIDTYVLQPFEAFFIQLPDAVDGSSSTSITMSPEYIVE